MFDRANGGPHAQAESPVTRMKPLASLACSAAGAAVDAAAITAVCEAARIPQAILVALAVGVTSGIATNLGLVGLAVVPKPVAVADLLANPRLHRVTPPRIG